MDRIYIFDTTLRDGGQTKGVDFSFADKIAISQALDDIGIDYIEGGWPGANPTDNKLFSSPPSLLALLLDLIGASNLNRTLKSIVICNKR